ncbi:hypothetical protein PCH_Pc16g02640 [Penicillium rubens Wisconsin 54-1255]|uniref:Uncharacterized protein n=1 Tax=Penicillium rubens (strain ATCC 28089 / DSM 1075 / NRRL 1951 / Wisconsin 54-1255) TaxID=500485 RepID=B6H750_PENRW|nr:hypothetical protein PCH_Pc16g02640 [Penicillium rubens Wisconsin 54-1255]
MAKRLLSPLECQAGSANQITTGGNQQGGVRSAGGKTGLCLASAAVPPRQHYEAHCAGMTTSRAGHNAAKIVLPIIHHFLEGWFPRKPLNLLRSAANAAKEKAQRLIFSRDNGRKSWHGFVAWDQRG